MARAARPKTSFVEEWRSLWEPDLEAIAFNGATCDPTRVDPKVLQWVKQHCAQKPHFIKVIIPGAVAKRLRKKSRLAVPGPFVEQHFRKLERVVKLENGATGKTWKVAFTTPKRQPMWEQGWFRVASDNNLKLGDVIVFVLVGNSHFRFTRFDEDGNNLDCHNMSTHPPHPATATIKKELDSSGSDESQSQYSEDSEYSVSDAEDVEHDLKLPCRDSKLRAPPLLSKKEQSTPESAEFRELVTPGKLGLDRQMADSPSSRKRRRLCKVEEKLKKCCDRGNLVTVNIDACDFEGGSTSMADNPSSYTTIVTVTPSLSDGEENFCGPRDFGKSRHSSSTAKNSDSNLQRESSDFSA